MINECFNIIAQSEEYNFVIDCASRDLGYDQTKQLLEDKFCMYISSDQYVLIQELFNISLDLEIGCRRIEWDEHIFVTDEIGSFEGE